MRPGDVLNSGTEILDPVLVPHGFRFEFRGNDKGSGGEFAWGEYVRGERRLELHFRWSLGMVTYHLADLHTAHEALMRAVLEGERSAYPGFSDDPLDGFRVLRQDLELHGTAFLEGPDAELRTLMLRAIEMERQRPRGLRALFSPKNR